MRVVAFVKATEDSEKGAPPTAEALEAFEAMDRLNEALVEAGIMIAGEQPLAQHPAQLGASGRQQEVDQPQDQHRIGHINV